MSQVNNNNYAIRAVKALIDGDSIKIDDDEYIYQDNHILVRAIRVDGNAESEIWLGGMCSEISLEYFLRYCAQKTFNDQVQDFPIKVSPKIRNESKA